VSRLLLAIGGVALAIVAVWQFVVTLRSGTFRARGGRTIRRARHPIMFWANVTGLAIVMVIGLAFAAWQY
jgi:hypothetical protein